MGRNKSESGQSEDSSDQQNQQERIAIRRPKIDRLDKFKNLKRIIINISMTQYPVVSQVASSLDWKIQCSNDGGDWDVYWTDFAIDPDILIKMHLFQKINHYPGIHVIARKNLLGLNLMSLRSKFPEEFNFFPLTWMLPLQYAEFRAYYESKPKGKARTYIAKPEAECQGKGIFLTRKIEDLQNGKHYVVQRYLARPYLLEGLKFDLRIYVLLCGTNPLRLYMYNDGLARLATEPYVEPSTSNLQKQYIHLTNYAINKNNPKFQFNSNSNNMGVGHKRSITCVFKQLQAKGVNIVALKEKINDVAIKTIICGLPLMSHQYKRSQPEDYSGNMCFHILGLDIMLNSLAEPVLLEVNHTPSFTTDTPLDHKIKFHLIRDTLKLMNINIQTKNQLLTKVKDINMERLVTGKRQIFDGKEREQTINEAQKLRDLYEDQHLGGFQRIFPIKDEERMKKYNDIIDTANRTYFQQNSPVRMKFMDKQGKRLIKSDQKQVGKPTGIPEKQKIKQPLIKLKNELLNKLQNPIHKVIRNTITSQNKSFCEHKEEPSIEKIEHLTKSEHRIDQQKEIQKMSEMFGLDELEANVNNPNSLIKVKKWEPERQRLTTKQARINRQIKSTPIQKTNQKISNLPTTQSIFSQKQSLINHSLIKNLARKQNASQNHHELFPNIESYMINNHLHSLYRKDDKLLSINKNQSKMKASSRGKIYQEICKDMHELIDRKSNFIMPKLVNLNLENERRSTESPSQNLKPPRKATIFQHNNNQ